MNEKYIVTIYQKIDLNENTVVFRRVGIVNDVIIKEDGGIEEITFYDDNRQRITLGFMENEYVMISDDQFCFGYPVTYDDLRKLYPDCLTTEELDDKYCEDISKVINIGYLDEEHDKVKILFTNEEELKKHDEDEIFKYLNIEYESDERQTVQLSLSDVKKINNLLQKKKYKIVKDKFEELNEAIEQISDQVFETVGYDLFGEKKKETETKEEVDINKSLDKLDDLTGLANIKKEVNKLIKYLLFKDKAEKYLTLESPNLHMFFTGNPGTGKTTVARIIGEILYSLGYIKNNTFAEITPKDLIAGYVGQTALKTSKFLKENEGGVIFVDEAYVFASEAQEFGEEALAEILKELEKKNTVFIFAGYKKEMDDFMRMNPGLTSRVGYYLEYQDYTEEELYQIFETKVTKMGFIIDDKLKEKIIENISKAKTNEHFGNGRYIDKLINKLILEHAINVENKTRKDKLITLTDKDYTDELEETLLYKVRTKKVGF